MNAALPPPRTANVRVLIAIAGLAAALFIVAPALAAWFALSDDIAQSKSEIVAAQKQLAAQPGLEAELAALRQRAQSAPGLLAGPSAALAQAGLAAQMKTLIESSHGVLMSASMLPPTRQKDFDQVAVEYDITIPFSRLKRFLYAVETHTPYIFFDETDMRIAANWRPAATEAPDPIVELRCIVHAYRWRART